MNGKLYRSQFTIISPFVFSLSLGKFFARFKAFVFGRERGREGSYVCVFWSVGKKSKRNLNLDTYRLQLGITQQK